MLAAKGEVQGCWNCERPEDFSCDICPMRDAEPWHFAVIRLYMRCRSWKTLPAPGGIEAQPEHIMRLFDILDRVVEEHRAAEMEKARIKGEQQARNATRGLH